MSKPAAEIDLPLQFIRELLVSQHPDLATESIAEITAGWNNAMFRLGSNMAIRLPRRSAAAALIKHEQRWLPLLQRVLPLPVPTPIRIGQPQRAYPWSWSIIPWIDGETVELGQLSGDQAPVLADFLEALHVRPPSLAPRNPYRGFPSRSGAPRSRGALLRLHSAAGRWMLGCSGYGTPRSRPRWTPRRRGYTVTFMRGMCWRRMVALVA